MSTQRDIERVLDAWLATGPSEMPDRVFHDALDRIERVPQRRAAWPTRFPAMFSISKLPLAAAVAALAIGLVTVPLWLGPPDATHAPANHAGPSPSGPPAPSPSATADLPLPEQLLGSWSAAPRGDIPGLFLSDTIGGWAIDSTFHTEHQDSSLSSRVTATGPDTFRLENVLGGEGCSTGSAGDYAWALSENGTRVTITPLYDDCAARAFYLEGTWGRTSCELDWSCAGRLEPGRHESAIFDPRADHEPRVARPGAVSYEVPEGWANADDWLSNLMLVPESGYQRLVEDPAIWPDQVRIWSTPVVALTVPGPDCTQWRADPEGGSTIESLAAWLEGHPDLDAKAPRPITIDGHPGLVVDTDMAIGPDTACPDVFDGGPGVPLFANGTDVRDDGVLIPHWELGGWDFGSGGVCPDCSSDPQRIILLDLDGQPLVILVDSEKAEDQAAFVEQAMPIVESFRFPE
jgi:hypothetical protein